MRHTSSRATWLAIAATLILSGCNSAPATKPQVDRSVVELSCSLPPFPADRTMAASTSALLDAWQAMAECRAAALAPITVPDSVR